MKLDDDRFFTLFADLDDDADEQATAPPVLIDTWAAGYPHPWWLSGDKGPDSRPLSNPQKADPKYGHPL